MRGISRSLPTKKNECLCRYLKPGALAQLRNSKISARSHRPISLVDHLITHPVGLPQISMSDQVPCFVNKIYGPQCLKRKKLVAARSMLFLNLVPFSHVLESTNNNNDLLASVLNNDVLVAH